MSIFENGFWTESLRTTSLPAAHSEEQSVWWCCKQCLGVRGCDGWTLFSRGSEEQNPDAPDAHGADAWHCNLYAGHRDGQMFVGNCGDFRVCRSGVKNGALLGLHEYGCCTPVERSAWVPFHLKLLAAVFWWKFTQKTIFRPTAVNLCLKEATDRKTMLQPSTIHVASLHGTYTCMQSHVRQLRSSSNRRSMKALDQSCSRGYARHTICSALYGDKVSVCVTRWPL